MIENATRGVAGVALLLMAVGITFDAVGRYALGTAVPGAMKVTEFFLMPAVVFLSWGVAQRSRKHVAVDILHGRLRGGATTVVNRVIDSFGLLLFVLVLVTALRATSDQWGLWTVERPSLPTGPSRAIVVLGASLMIVRLVVQIITGRTTRAHDDRDTDAGTPGDSGGDEAG